MIEEYWTPVHKEGYYEVYRLKDLSRGMAAIRDMFKADWPIPDKMNLIMFSTGGVHGSTETIEDCENGFVDCDGIPMEPEVTFLIIQPRRVCVYYGNCKPQSADDFTFLKMLRQKSWDVMRTIGALETEAIEKRRSK